MRISVIQLGARRNYSIPLALNGIGRLSKLYTDFFFDYSGILMKFIRFISGMFGGGPLSRVLSRTVTGLDMSVVSRSFLLGLRVFFAERTCSKSKLQVEQLYAATALSRRFFHDGAISTEAVWGFNGASLLLFTVAKQNKILCILDQVSLPAVVEANIGRDLGFDGVNQQHHDGPTNLMATVESLEWSLADYIIVGSDFVKKSLVNFSVDKKKITVIPSSVDINTFRPIAYPTKYDGNRNLRVLFVGRVSRAKGTGFLLEAAKHLANEKIEIKLVGNIIDLQEQITSLSDVVTAVGHVSYSDIVKYYQWADVFCFPSCFEGSASVTYEALACGLPVITTVNAGSVVRHGIDGFIIPVGCAQSVYDAIKQYLDRPELLGVHRDNVLDNRLLLGADGYRQRLTDFIIHIENGIIN